MSSNNDLNTIGRILLPTTATIATNLVVHPLCTLKTRWMNRTPAFPREQRRIPSLYRGAFALNATESLQLSLAYMLQQHFENQGYGSNNSSIVASLLTVPITSIGESIMIERQMRARNRSMFNVMCRALRQPGGMTATMLRESPYIYTLIGAAPALEKALPMREGIARQAVAGAFSGAVVGLMSFPFDLVKTEVQSQNISLRDATRTLAKRAWSSQGLRHMAVTASARTAYVGLSACIYTISQYQLMNWLPESCRNSS